METDSEHLCPSFLWSRAPQSIVHGSVYPPRDGASSICHLGNTKSSDLTECAKSFLTQHARNRKSAACFHCYDKYRSNIQLQTSPFWKQALVKGKCMPYWKEKCNEWQLNRTLSMSPHHLPSFSSWMFFIQAHLYLFQQNRKSLF